MILAPGIDEIRAAAERIRGLLRRTPLLAAAPAKEQPQAVRGLLLKLESLQATGSFNPRGAVNALLALPSARLQRGIVTALGGNHGLAVAYAGWAAGNRRRFFCPVPSRRTSSRNLPPGERSLLVSGEVWDESNRAALRHAEAEGLSYIHPFADPNVIAGQGTIALEILAEAAELDTLVVAIGSGGLISGVAIAVKSLKPDIRIIGVEPAVAPTLHASLAADRLVELTSLATAAVTLAPRRSEMLKFAIVGQTVERIVLVEDAEMRAAARWLWNEMGIAAGLSGVAALLAGHYRPAPEEQICAIVCGAGTDGMTAEGSC